MIIGAYGYWRVQRWRIWNLAVVTNITFDFSGYDHWRLWILAGTALADIRNLAFVGTGHRNTILR